MSTRWHDHSGASRTRADTRTVKMLRRLALHTKLPDFRPPRSPRWCCVQRRSRAHRSTPRCPPE
eukprot:792861-Pyramimonas_sp.AAC.1